MRPTSGFVASSRSGITSNVDSVVGSVYNASVWGSGLIRVDVGKQAIELTFRDTEPETLAAIVAAHLQTADGSYRYR